MMRIVRWVLLALGFLIGSAFGQVARSGSPVEDLSVRPPPSESDDPHELSGWGGSEGLRRGATSSAAGN